MKEIQEKRIENEVNQLQENPFFYRIIKKISFEEMMIELKYTHPEEGKDDIFFILHMLPNYPFVPPRLYCKSAFSYPSIADGRDILEEILNQQWTTSIKIVDIADKIPQFIIDFLNNLKEGTVFLSGNYLLDEKYDLSLFEQLPVYIQKIKERVNIDGKDKEFNKIMVISDMFFCLFDQERWSKNNLKLTFWSNIKSLVTIKKTVKGDLCRFFWKQKSKRNTYELSLLVQENSDKIIDLLLSKMKNFGINYKVSRILNEPKEGHIPPIDIESVEKTILELEDKINHSDTETPEAAHIEYLLELYSQAIEYYSATNNTRYEVFKRKIQNLMKKENLTEIVKQEHERLDSSEKEKIEHNLNIDIDIKEDEEKKEDEEEKIKINENSTENIISNKEAHIDDHNVESNENKIVESNKIITDKDIKITEENTLTVDKDVENKNEIKLDNLSIANDKPSDIKNEESVKDPPNTPAKNEDNQIFEDIEDEDE